MDQDWLSIGRMASLNCITDKTLRFYHDKGVLVPERVDPENGRRYYSLKQCSTLDFIQQMQTTGLSLQDIKTIVETGDEGLLRQALTERRAELRRQQRVIDAALAATDEMIQGLDLFDTHRKSSSSVVRETLPEQRIWEFPLGQDDLPNISDFDYDAALDTWLRDLRGIKIAIAKTLDSECLEIPIALLFRNVGARYSRQACLDRSPEFASAFVVVPSLAWEALEEHLTVIPAGDYLTLSSVGMADAETNERATIRAAQALLHHAGERGFTPAGDLFIEVPSDIPALVRGKSEDIFKVRLRVEA